MSAIAFVTFGCRANHYQTSRLEAYWLQAGDQKVSPYQPADLYIINSCLVTLDAERKVRQTLRRVKSLAKKVILTGCLAKLKQEELLTEFPWLEFLPSPPLNEESIPPPLNVEVRANLMVEDGCENFCSYCIVPQARGPIKSKPINQALSEAKKLIEAGARELVLTGINLGAYQLGLSLLIEKLTALSGLFRLRLSSIEPPYLTDQLIKTIAKEPKVCPHLHLPLQSGSDRILLAMNRKYSQKEYLALVNKAQHLIPGLALTTDLIVGFPGEEESDFLATCQLVQEAGFSRLHIFPFSRRPGTPAATLPQQVNGAIIQKRKKRLQLLNEELATSFASAKIGQKIAILVEQKGIGMTSDYVRVFYGGKRAEIGKIITVQPKKVLANGSLEA